MKYVWVVLSGAGDQPKEDQGVKTPLDVAKLPYLHAIVKAGRLGRVKLASNRCGAYPDVTLLNLLGYESDKFYTGRGPLEAANLELKLEPNEIPFRMNFITESNEHLADPQAGNITVKEARALINFLNKKVASDFVRFFPGQGYRNIVVIKDAHGYDALSAKTYCPHDIVGTPIKNHLPKGPGGELMKKLMYDAKLLLQDHEVNQVRVDLGENPANMIWVWGQGQKPSLERFNERYGFSASMITDAAYAKGIARLCGMTVVDTKVKDEDLSENYDQKGKLLLEQLQERDFVCLHLKDCDEASREGDLKAKISALEATDYFILSKLKSFMDRNQEARCLITTGHSMPWQLRKRTRDLVPFVISGKNIMPDDSIKFSELASQASEFKMDKPAALLTQFFAK